jgi:hypothetical protein
MKLFKAESSCICFCKSNGYVFVLVSVLSKIVPLQEVNEELKGLANFASVL